MASTSCDHAEQRAHTKHLVLHYVAISITKLGLSREFILCVNFTAFSIVASCLDLSSITVNAAMFNGVCMNAPVIPHQNGDRTERVSSDPELQQAISSLTERCVILIAPGEYSLTITLRITSNNVTIRGGNFRCNEVVQLGKGMKLPKG